MVGELLKECEKIAEKVRAERAYLHKYPELSEQEYETLAYIRRRLDAMRVPFLEVEKGGDPCTAGFEAERKNFAFACGHDAHISMMLHATKILKEHIGDMR